MNESRDDIEKNRPQNKAIQKVIENPNYVPNDSDEQRTTPPEVRENQETEGRREDNFRTNDEITNVSGTNSLTNGEGETNGSLREATEDHERESESISVEGEIFCQFVFDENDADVDNCLMTNLDFDIPTENSTYDLENIDQDSISRRVNPVENDADLDEFQDFLETNSIFSEAVDYEEFEDLVQDLDE